MTKRTLWDGKSYGKDDFDTRAGYEWENGPDQRAATGLNPDVPWNLYKPGNRILWDNRVWVVTSFGLEPFYSSNSEKYEWFMIPTSGLLAIDARGGVHFWPIAIAENDWLDLAVFEEAFKKAIKIHQCRADENVLKVSFKRAHGLRRRGKVLRTLRRGISAPHRTAASIPFFFLRPGAEHPDTGRKNSPV